MTVKRPPAPTGLALLAAGLLALAAGCDVDEPTSRVPTIDAGGGGGVDPGAGEGEGEGECGPDGLGFVSCVAPGAEGNQLGVGKYCEPKGGQCAGLAAPFCSADFHPRETSTGCTFVCLASEECGEGATCLPPADPQDLGGECVPTLCVPVEG